MLRFISLFLLALALVFPSLAQESGNYDASAEQQLVDLINQARKDAGQKPLALDDRLTSAARAHAELLAQHGSLSHQFPGEPTLPKRLAATNLRFNFDGENVAFDSDLQSAHQGLMNSPPHRANILNPKFNAVGVGVVRKGNTIYVTEDFAHRLEQISESEAADRAAQAFAEMRKGARFLPAKRISQPNLHRIACQMAQRDRLDASSALGLPNVRQAVAFTESEPGKLPQGVLRLKDDPTVQHYAVDACFAASANYPSGTYWMVMVFY